MVEIIRVGPALAIALTVAGCAGFTAAVTSANQTLAQLAQNDLPTACGIVAVAEGYFAELKPSISAKNIATEAKAAAAVNAICNGPPPANVGAAIASLANAWIAVQNATVTQ
jgi:hypothetical protein